MRIVGLTGGIGSGKSSVSAGLARLGYAVVDADAITRELQMPGEPTLAGIVDAFGSEILLADGSLDRAGLARRVFPQPDELARLNAVVHPAVARRIAERLDEHRDTDDTVILDVPLLVESGRGDLHALVVVDIEPDLAVQRLVRHRGFDEADARARIARQADRAERLARADFVIDNSGDLDHLEAQVNHLHRWLTSRSV